MKNRTISLALIFIGIIFYLSACQSKVEVDETFSDYTPPPAFFNDEELAILNEKLDLPNGIEHTYGVSIPITGGNFVFNTDKVIATIGRVLFYDKGLSIDQSTSCSTCHLQEAAFGENIPVSLGLNNEHGKRNSIALGSFISMRRQYYSSTSSNFFWDERASTIHEQMTEAFESPIEMGMDIPTLVERVKAEPHYQILFEKAYGDNQITSNRIFSTLQGFMSAIYSANTRFDKIFKQPENTSLHSNFKNFTSSENQGKKLFIDNCGSCHGGSLTTSFGANPNVANSGLDIIYEDKGVGSVTLNTDDNGKFKVPSLRNIEVTYPYMHDGRFETLEEVIDFYSTNIQPHPNLTEKLKNLDGTPKQFNFSNSDRKNLVDFLETLTDHELLMNPKYSDPFKH